MSDIFFAILQAVVPGRKAPCIMIDCLWSRSPDRLKMLVQKRLIKLGEKGVDKYLVWARREIKAYSEAFGLPEHKLMFIPYHTTLDTFDVTPWDGGYIFSGGNFGRDYKTLITAVKGLPVKVLIASTDPQLFVDISIPNNVEVRGFGHVEYLQKMAGCLINVVCLDKGILRSGGQQTFLNSMWFGKPTIVTDPEGAADYITHGEDGFLVPPRDPIALRRTIELLLKQPETISEMGIKAAQRVKFHTTEDFFKMIVSITHSVIESR